MESLVWQLPTLLPAGPLVRLPREGDVLAYGWWLGPGVLHAGTECDRFIGARYLQIAHIF